VIVRRLSAAGLEEFERFLDSLTTDTPLPVPSWLLIDPAMSEVLPRETVIEKKKFDNRSDAAKYLNEIIPQTELAEPEKDAGLWAWLALFFFDQFCAADSSGRYKPGARAKWVPATGDYRRYYRHLLAGPYLIYRAHRDEPNRALVLLCGPLDRPGDVVEQLASRQEIVTNKAVLETATKLYINPETSLPKKGAASKAGGSARRFAEILNQFDVTWDLSIMTSSDLLAMLPKEFDKFRSTNK
jgi:hypothetical protein